MFVFVDLPPLITKVVAKLESNAFRFGFEEGSAAFALIELVRGIQCGVFSIGYDESLRYPRFWRRQEHRSKMRASALQK